MNRYLKITTYIIGAIFALILLLILLVNISPVQRYFANLFLSQLEKEVNGKIELNKIKVTPFNITVEDFIITSDNYTEEIKQFKKRYNQDDTLVKIESLKLFYSFSNLFKKPISITKLKIDGGVFNLQYEKEASNIDRIFPKKEKEKKGSNLFLTLNELEVKNFRFTLSNPLKMRNDSDKNIIDFSDLNVRNINLKANKISYKSGDKDSIKVKLDYLNGIDKSAFKIRNLSGDVLVTDKRASIKSFILDDGHTKLQGSEFAMNYNNAKTLAYFTDSVKLEAKLQNSLLNFVTLSKLSPGLKNSTLVLSLNGNLSGTINNLSGENIHITNSWGETNISIPKVKIIGLPDANNSYLKLSLNSITTNGNDLSRILADLTGEERIKFLEEMPPLAIFTYYGEVEGKLNNLNVSGVLEGAGGSTDLNLAINRENPLEGIDIRGKINSNNFNVSSIIGGDLIGNFNGTAKLAIKGRGENTTILIDSVSIKSLKIKSYNLTNTFVKGRYSNNIFQGKIIAHDPAIDLMFEGEIPTSNKGDRVYNFFANVPYANLKALGLEKQDRESEVSLTLNTNFVLNDDKEIFGKAKISNATFRVDNTTHNLGNILLASDYRNEKYYVEIISDFLKGRFEGSGMITNFSQELRDLIVNKHFKNLIRSDAKNHSGVNYQIKYNLTLETFNTQGICALLMDGLYIQNGSSLSVDIADNDDFRISLNSGRIAYKENYLKNLRFNVRNRDSILVANLFSKEIKFSDLQIDSTRISVRGADNNFDLDVKFRNDTTGLNRTNLNAALSFLENKEMALNGIKSNISYPIQLDIKESDIQIKGVKWDILPSQIIYSDSLLSVDKLMVKNGDQSLIVDGILSQSIPDSLGIKMNKFNIAIIDQFLSKPFALNGLISGSAAISNNKENTRMFATFVGDSISINNTPLGELDFKGNWDKEDKNYKISLKSKDGNKTNMSVDGYFRPKDSYLNLETTLNSLSLNYFEPILSSVITNTSGAINGKLKIFGPLNNLNVIGENCSFENYKFTLDYTKVPYTLNGAISITENGVDLSKCTLSDNFGGKATIKGGVTYNNFKNIKINTELRLRRVHALNTKFKDNEDFYGNGIVTGTVGLKGTLENLLIDLNLRTEAKTHIHIPLSGSSKATKTELLTFVEEKKNRYIDPYDSIYLAKKIDKNSKTNLAVDVKVNATPDAEIWLEINKNAGDIVKAKGRGNIGINVAPAEDKFSLTGNYVISEGKYHFVLMGLAARDFIVEEGSKVALNGDPKDIDLDITAHHRTKAAINRLIADTTSVNTTRLVDAIIYIKGKLANPNIKFGLDIPDIDPTTKVKVQGAINTEEKIQRQVAALLVSGGFIPDIESGVSSSGSEALYSSAYDILTNQLNSIFGELGIPLDLGFNYIPGEKSASDAFDVAVSTQLFNNRVLINGSIGNDPYSDYNGRDVIGNIDVEIKLDRKGQLRLNLFSHSTDRYSNDLEESQKNGVGIAYQHEFNSFREIFRRKTAAQKEFEKIVREREREERRKRKEEAKNSRKEILTFK